MSESSYRWKRNKQLLFLGGFLLILAVAVWLLTRQYPLAWLLIVVALLGSLQPVFILLGLRQMRSSDSDRSQSALHS